MLLQGGIELGLNTLASAALLSAGEIKMFINGPAGLSLKGGGVGFYPSSNFVHVDTGRVRYW